VALPQMDPNTEEGTDAAGKPLPEIAPWKKIPVALAGAVGNIILAFIVAWIIFFIGKPSAPHERDTVVGHVEADSEAYEQGLRAGHRIVSVNGEAVRNWSDIMVGSTLSMSVALEAETPENRLSVLIPTHDTNAGIRLIPGVSWVSYADVAQVVSGSSAEAAGVKVGDRLLELKNHTIYSQAQLIALVDEYRGQSVPLVVRREGERVELEVTPTYDPAKDRALIGIGFNPWAVDFDEVIHPEPTELVMEFSTLIFRVLGALVTPSTSGMAASALAGPVFILKSLWDMVQNSFAMALWFTCLLNVNLAVLNLMPVPVLDGGHIVFSLWEVITRRKINARFKVGLMTACWFLLIGAMLFLSYRDVTRMGWLSREPVAEEEAVMDSGSDELAGEALPRNDPEPDVEVEPQVDTEPAGEAESGAGADDVDP
jgi:regulator of sigma E protease